jgi:hypothetical protein
MSDSRITRPPFGSPLIREPIPLEERRSSALNPNERTVIIFTDSDREHQGFADRTVAACAESGVTAEHVTVSGANLPATIAALRQAGKIVDGTQIIINMHGKVPQKDNPGNEHLLDESVATCDVVRAVRESLDGKGCSANIYITACQSGNDTLRDRLQKLHKDRDGACFLLSSKKDVLTTHCQFELNNMVDLFRYAEIYEQAPPSPHIILARMLSYQMDCISMVDREGLTIRHAPKDESQFGLAGVIADIEDRLGARTQPSAQPPNEAKKIAKPKLSTKTDSATKLHEAASTLAKILEFGEKKPPKIAGQRNNVLFRKVLRLSNPAMLEATLRTDREFRESYDAEDWNVSHSLLSVMIENYFYKEEKIDEKLKRLLALMIDKKEAFGKLGVKGQQTLLDSWDDPLVEYLNQENFFSHAPSWISAWSAKNDNLMEFMDRVDGLEAGLAKGEFESLAIYFLMLKAIALDGADSDDTKVRFLCAAAPEDIGVIIQPDDIQWFLSVSPHYASSDDVDLEGVMHSARVQRHA